MKVYSIALFLFIFGAATGAVDGMGICGSDIALSTEMNETYVEEVQEITQSHASWLFWIPMMIYRFAQILFSAFTTAITIIPLFIKYGVPLDVIVMIQTPIWLVYAVGIIQFVVGRSFKAND